ncbi:MAG TPA: hypothetical protein VF553_18610 [Pyrinomonadaceae bacterium]
MQATVNVSHTNLPGGVNGKMSRLSKPSGRITPILSAMVLMCMLVPMVRAQSNAQMPVTKPTSPAPQSDAKKAFEKMKTLAGSWQGTIMGISIDFTIRAASSGTAILHEGNTGGGRPPNHEITMFYVDGDRLLATHYCDAGNRARWEGKMSPDGKTIEFSFIDVAGSTRGGYLRGMVFTMIDANRHTIEATFIMPDGKPIQFRGEFQRTE